MRQSQRNRRAAYSGGCKRRYDEAAREIAQNRDPEAEPDPDPVIEIDIDARVKHVRIREPRNG